MEKNEVEIIEKLCDCNMNVSMVAKELHMHRNSVVYQIGRIEDKYGLNPCCFGDLIKLSKMAGIAENYECGNTEELIKAFPLKKQELIRAVLTAKTVVIIDTKG